MTRYRKSLALLMGVVGCDRVFGLPAVTPQLDAPADAPDAPPDPDAQPMCPPEYVIASNDGTSHYRLAGATRTFTPAADDCADDEAAAPITGHTHLAVLSDTTERDFLYSLGANRWIGLTDLAVAGTWQWVTTENGLSPAPNDAMLWASGEPNNPTTEHCGHFDSSHMNFVNNVPCTQTHPYVCECNAYANVPSTYR